MLLRMINARTNINKAPQAQGPVDRAVTQPAFL